MTGILAASSMPIDISVGWFGLLLALVVLTTMEIVLGIDNILFISIVTSKLPKEQQRRHA